MEMRVLCLDWIKTNFKQISSLSLNVATRKFNILYMADIVAHIIFLLDSAGLE